MMLTDGEEDLRCGCVRVLVQIPPDEREHFRLIEQNYWADSRCICKGEGLDPRLLMLWEFVKDARAVINLLDGRVEELERRLRLPGESGELDEGRD
jgi:hypothetical protein